MLRKLSFLRKERAVADNSIPRGTLRIGSFETTAVTRLPYIISDYHMSYPEVDLTFRYRRTNISDLSQKETILSFEHCISESMRKRNAQLI